MERDVGMAFKKQKYSELALARLELLGSGYTSRFNADLDDFMVILPYKPPLIPINFNWILWSINHEYLHLIIAELESNHISCLLDNLGYNLATGYTEEGDC